MLSNQGQACSAVPLLVSADAANTAGATSDWIPVNQYEGDLVFVVDTGVVTAGQVVWTIEDATSDAGAGGAGITPNEGAFTTVTTSNDPLLQKRTITANRARDYVRLVGTVTTGPVQCSAVLLATKKYT